MDPRQIDAVLQAATAYANPGRVPNPVAPTGFEGLPSFQSLFGPTLGMAADYAGQAFVGSQMHGLGMTPFGIGHDQNAYDFVQAQHFGRLRAQAVRRGAELDRRGYRAAMEEAARKLGVPIDAGVSRTIDEVTRYLAADSPGDRRARFGAWRS